MRETTFKKLSELAPGLLESGASVEELLGKVERLKERARVVQDNRCPACLDTRFIEVDGGVRRCPKCRPTVKTQLAAAAATQQPGDVNPLQAELRKLLIEIDESEGK